MGLIEVRIEAMLEKRGRTFDWLVRETKIPYARLLRISRGTVASIRLDTIVKLCTALQCQPGDLLFMVDPSKRRSSRA